MWLKASKYKTLKEVVVYEVLDHIFLKLKNSDMDDRQMSGGLNLKSELILDHILDHLKEETDRDNPKKAEKQQKDR